MPPAVVPTGDTAHLKQPAPWILDEETSAVLKLEVKDVPPEARVALIGLPPGAVFDEAARTISFAPDFTQGGWQSLVKVMLVGGGLDEKVVFPLGVKDTIRPPAPVVVREEDAGDATVYVLSQQTDGFLDAPGYAGRTFNARVVVPKGIGPAKRAPVHVELHGVSGTAATTAPRVGFVTLLPEDPALTYWWGYADGLPAATTGAARPYTQRRVLHLLEWALKRFPGADPERVTVGGWSMGGAGALALALLHPRHFSGVLARDAATIPRLHRPERLAQLSMLWGPPGAPLDDGAGLPVWDRLDLTRALRDDPQARDVFVVTKSGKDDFVVHFDAVVGRSAVTGLSFIESLERYGVARVVAWDEGGHGPPDPTRPATWWEGAVGQLAEARRDRPQAAFVASSNDADPGTGKGNGRRPWSADRGFAGDVTVSGDTGWDGDLAGARGAGLYFRGGASIDAVVRFEVPLSAGTTDVVTDIVPRRLRQFRPLPGQVVRWRCGPSRGIATVKPDGTFRLAEVPLSTEWRTLTVELSDLPAMSSR